MHDVPPALPDRAPQVVAGTNYEVQLNVTCPVAGTGAVGLQAALFQPLPYTGEPIQVGSQGCRSAALCRRRHTQPPRSCWHPCPPFWLLAVDSLDCPAVPQVEDMQVLFVSDTEGA
jgi:hypothetical protein